MNIKNSDFSILNLKLAKNIIFFIFSSLFTFSVHLFLIKFYSIEILGNFTIIFVYIFVVSQLSAFGFQNYLIYFIKNYNDVPSEHLILFRCLFYSLIAGIIVALISFILSDLLGFLLNNKQFSNNLKIACISLIFFGCSRVFASFLNMKNYLILFGLINTIRYLSILIFILFSYFLRFDYYIIFYCFLFAEIIIIMYSLIIIYFYNIKIKINFILDKKILNYSIQSFLSNFFISINLKIDVLMISILLSEYYVGVYALVIIFFDGFLSILFVLRDFLMPQLNKLIYQKDYKKLIILKKYIQLRVFTFICLSSFLLLIIYIPMIDLFNLNSAYKQNWYPLFTLLLSLAICSITLPFHQTLISLGNFKMHTSINAIVLFSNILLNYYLIQIFGINGAAISTAISMFIGSFLIIIFNIKNKKLNWILKF